LILLNKSYKKLYQQVWTLFIRGRQLPIELYDEEEREM